MSETTLPEGEATTRPAAMSVRGAAIWAMAGQYVGFAIQFVTSVLISRFFLAPAEVGLFSIAMAAALLVAVLQDFGLSRYISALPKLDRREISRCGSISLLFSLLVAGIIVAIAWPLAHLYETPALGPLLAIIGSSYLFLPLAIVPLALMARDMQFRGHFAVNVGGAVIQAGVAIGLAALGFSAFALAWATVASGVARGAIAQFLRLTLPWPLHFSGSRDVLSFGTKSSALYVSGALGTRSPDLILGKLLTLASVGLYSRAASLTEQLRMLLAGAIGSVLFPAFARIRDRGEPPGPAYLRVCAGYSAIVWPGMAGLALAAEPIVRLLYGDLWIEVAPLLSLIAIHTTILIALPMVSDLPILLGRMNRLIAYNLADTVMSLLLLAIGCLWGVEGAAWSRIAYALFWFVLHFEFMYSTVKFDLREWLSINAKSLAATAMALMPLAATYLFWQSPTEITFMALAAGSACGVVTWFITLVLLRHPAMHDINAIITAALRPVPLQWRVWSAGITAPFRKM